MKIVQFSTEKFKSKQKKNWARYESIAWKHNIPLPKGEWKFSLCFFSNRKNFCEILSMRLLCSRLLNRWNSRSFPSELTMKLKWLTVLGDWFLFVSIEIENKCRASDRTLEPMRITSHTRLNWNHATVDKRCWTVWIWLALAWPNIASFNSIQLFGSQWKELNCSVAHVWYSFCRCVQRLHRAVVCANEWVNK